MNRNALLLLLSLLGLLLATPRLAAQETASDLESTAYLMDEEEEDEIDWMLDQLFLASEQLYADEAMLFSALAHGLSIADVATAEGARPLDLLDAAVALEESEILDLLLEGEITKDEAAEWREMAWDDATWMLFEEDPFGLNDIVFLLDGASWALDLEILELVGWMSEGHSISAIALELETDPIDVAELAMEALADEIDTLLLLGELEEEDAKEWMAWSEEMLPELLEDGGLLEALAEEAWIEEVVAMVAEWVETEEDGLWEQIMDGATLTDIVAAAEVDLTAVAEDWDVEAEDLHAEIAEVDAWMNEDAFEFEDDDAADGEF
ncbi:MAG: hypothetical protein ACPG31_05280 [Planctomycetota bacterium]